MNKTLAGTAAAILLPAGMVAVMAALPAAADEPPGAPSAAGADAASPEMLAAMQRDLGLTAAGARDRIAKDNAASRTQLTLRKKLGSAYGGAWLTADAKSFVVAVTDEDKAAEVTAAGATPELVSRSEARLDAIKDGLDKAGAKAPAATVPGWYVDSRTNTVVVQARGDTAAAEAFIEASGVDTAAVRVVRTTEQPRTLYDVRGGDDFWNGYVRCSVGFSVSGGFVSAGHCGNAGDKTDGFNGAAQGVFKGSSFPGNDYSYIQVNEEWTPRPWVNGGSDGNVIVAGSTVAPVGSAVCRSGATSGWRCGTVLALNQTVNYSQGDVTDLTRTNVCAEKGDSGGSWLSGQQAQGVTSGGSGDCTSGGTTYFQPVNEILRAYRLTLVTDRCAGFKFSVTGSLDKGGTAYAPTNSYYNSTGSGTHRGCLDGPDGADFDLVLLKWTDGAWQEVAWGVSNDADEDVTYNGTAGYYTWQVKAWSGSGSYSVGYTTP